MNSSEQIRPDHLKRSAIIYVRQSTTKQIEGNRESLELQYALRAKAKQLGWSDESISIIDADLGISGSSATGRVGFQEVVSRVSLGQIGIVFAYDATRLARNCSDWYQLLDLCGFRDCLIGDVDSVYDPSSVNGRLLLGLKGQISELELHTLRSRLNAGMLNKAKRGELVVDVPAGFVKGDAPGTIEMLPDREAQSRIALVFQLFLRLKSLGKVVRCLNRDQLLLPRRVRGGGICWREPTLSAVSSMLRNPTYAGAYAYGKTRFVPQTSAPHKRRKQRIDRDQWKVLIENHHHGYITWEEFMKIQEILENNHAEYHRKRSPGTAKSGAALLQGIVYCARCGHQMTIQYHPHAKYTCNFLYQQRRASVCAVIRADRIDRAVEQVFWKAIQPEELDFLEEAEARRAQETEGIRVAREQQLQRLRYQAELAERRYQECDPGNRLVAGALEERWEFALRALRAEEERLQREPLAASRPELTPKQRLAWQSAGASLRDLWNDGRLSAQQKKRVLRSLIQKVILQIVQPGLVSMRIVWRGGHVDTRSVSINVSSLDQLHNGAEIEERIVEMAMAGYSDEWIAYHLSKQGFRQSHLMYVSIGLVSRVRCRKRILRTRQAVAIPDGCLTLSQAKRRTRVTLNSLFELILDGRLAVKTTSKARHLLIPGDDATLKNIQQWVAAGPSPSCAQQGVST
jgi:DNA invertase Pin-like site-specific DNA recombinase